MNQFMVTALFTLLLIAVVQAYPSGAGNGACTNSNMSPKGGHGDSTTADNSPYNITANASSYNSGDTINVTLAGVAFKGFLVMALAESNPNSSEPVGVFAVNNVTSKRRCNGGATHANANAKTSITLTWTAPSTTVGDIKFYATFVKSKTEYYVKQPSSLIMKVKVPTTTMKSAGASTRHHGIMFVLRDIISWMICILCY